VSSAVTVTNISESFTYKKMAAKINWYRYGTIIKSLSRYVFSFVYVLILLIFSLVLRDTTCITREDPVTKGLAGLHHSFWSFYRFCWSFAVTKIKRSFFQIIYPSNNRRHEHRAMTNGVILAPFTYLQATISATPCNIMQYC